MALPQPGTVFADKYLIESQLGRGSVGVVLAATHLELRQPVAIKLLQGACSTADERLVREARATLALQSEHVVRVMDVGRDQGRVFVVMEQLRGADLKSLLDTRGKFSVAEAVDYVLQACAGVAEAHARGIVHRDLKPSNLFLTTRADHSLLVKVLDFGISKFGEHEDLDGTLTGSGEILGSPMYMSPEQVRGAKTVDHRTDIWSLGVTLYRFLTGTAPFGGPGLRASAALASVVSDDPRPLTQLAPEVPRALEAIVMRCLSKSPANRCNSVAELAAALAPFGTDEGRSGVARLLRAAPAAERGLAHSRRRRLLIASAIAALSISMATVVLSSARKSHPALRTDSVPAAMMPHVEPAPPPTAVATAAAQSNDSVVAPVPSFAPAPRPPARPAPRAREPSHSSAAKSAAINDRY